MNENHDKIKQALELKKEQRYEEAIEIINKLYSNDPTSNEIKNTLIEILFEYGGYLNDEWVEDFERAKECYRKIISLDETHYRAWYNLGITYFNLRETEKAMEAYQQALKIKPDYEYIYYNIGLLYEIHKKDLDNALKYYEEALRLNESFTYALQALRDVRQRLEHKTLHKNKKIPSTFESDNICKKCGNINRSGAKFCDKCGEPSK